MAIANLTVRFLVELMGIGALAYWGLQVGTDDLTRIIFAIGSALALIVPWAVVVAPKARNGLSQPHRDVIGTGLLLAAAVALAAAGQPTFAVGFGAIVLLNSVLLRIFDQDPASAIRSMGGR